MMTIRNKILAGFTFFIFLFLLNSYSGYHSVHIISESLKFVTGPAWDAADGAMEGTIGVQAEVITLQKRLLLNISEQQATSQLKQDVAFADEALGRMFASGLMDGDSIRLIKQQLSTFRQTSQSLIKSHAQFTQLHHKVNQIINQIDEHLMQAEESFETAMDKGQMAGLNQSEVQLYWDVADAIMESRINLLRRSRLHADVINGISSLDQQRQQFSSSLQLLNDQINVLLGSTIAASHLNAHDLQTAYKDYQLIFDQSLEQFKQYHALEKDINLQTRALFETIEVIEEQGDSKVEAEVSNVEPTISQAVLMIILTGAIAIIFTGLGYTFIYKHVLQPLSTVTRHLRVFSQGEGDLTVSLPVIREDELGQLAISFNHFVEKLRLMMRDIQTASNYMKSCSTELKKVSGDMIAGIFEQQEETRQARQAMDNMSNKVSDVSDNANQAAQTTSRSNAQALEGRQIVNDTVAAINLLEENIKHATTVVNELSKNSEGIGTVVEVIRSIAEQTNLLALNAAIEAARAGEQGRGFAVVADEVRTLAGRTQESTTEIHAMIQQIQNDTAVAVNVMHESFENSSQTVVMAGNAGQSLESITQSIAQINRMNNQIAELSNDQKVVAQSVCKNVTKILEIADNSTDGVNQTMTSIDKLVELSNKLETMIGQFKL